MQLILIFGIYVAMDAILIDKYNIDQKLFFISERIKLMRISKFLYLMSQCRLCVSHNFAAFPTSVVFGLWKVHKCGLNALTIYDFCLSLSLLGMILVFNKVKN